MWFMQSHVLSTSYQSHDFPDGPLDVQDLSALNADKAPLAAQLWEENVGSVHFHHFADLIQTIEQDIVDLARIDNDILDVDFHTQDQFPQLLLRASNLLRRVSRDIDFIFASTARARRGVAEDPREWRGKVDGGAGGGFDKLDVFASPSTDQGMHGQLQFNGVHMAFQLWFCVSPAPVEIIPHTEG